MLAALATVAVALALWALLGVIFADDLRELDQMQDFADDLDALGRVTQRATPEGRVSPTQPPGSGHPNP